MYAINVLLECSYLLSTSTYLSRFSRIYFIESINFLNSFYILQSRILGKYLYFLQSNEVIYTVFEKLYPFYFCNNFFIREPIFIIFGSNMSEEFATKRILYFPPHLMCVLLLYLVTQAASLTDVHSCCNEFLRTPFLQTLYL